MCLQGLSEPNVFDKFMGLTIPIKQVLCLSPWSPGQMSNGACSFVCGPLTNICEGNPTGKLFFPQMLFHRIMLQVKQKTCHALKVNVRGGLGQKGCCCHLRALSMLIFFFPFLPIFPVSVCEVQLQPWFPSGGRFCHQHLPAQGGGCQATGGSS